ncbi:M20/M25/M40 family metallo-hydrolase [Candidatus Woesearchaeota archaeon]|nr:M20/M25/M40 family metallo-hydrolase [Candidatus Woesearchaeota archaeon]
MREMEGITELAKELIRFKTVSGNCKAAKDCLGFIARQLKQIKIGIRHYEFGGFPSLIAYPNPTRNCRLVLVGHIDVVPAPESMFKPRVVAGKLYGRGAIDMKAQVAAMIAVVKKLGKRCSVGLMLTSDEELGGKHGVKQLLDIGYKADFFIAPDGGFDFELITKEKGVLWLEINVRGKSAHASRPWEGVNAIEELIAKLKQIKALFPKGSANSWVNTINISKIEGGDAPNKVPCEAKAVIDIRYTSKPDAILKKIGNIVEYKVLEFAPVFTTDENSPQIKSLARVMSMVLGREVEPSFEHGASDARYFAELGIPGAIFAPKGDNPHGDGEYVVIDSLYKFYKILELFAQESF